MSLTALAGFLLGIAFTVLLRLLIDFRRAGPAAAADAALGAALALAGVVAGLLAMLILLLAGSILDRVPPGESTQDRMSEGIGPSGPVPEGGSRLTGRADVGARARQEAVPGPGPSPASVKRQAALPRSLSDPSTGQKLPPALDFYSPAEPAPPPTSPPSPQPAPASTPITSSGSRPEPPGRLLDPRVVTEAWEEYLERGDGRFAPGGFAESLSNEGLKARVLTPEELQVRAPVLGVTVDDSSRVIVVPSFLHPARAVEEWFADRGGGAFAARISRLIEPAEVELGEDGPKLIKKGIVA